MAMVCAMCGSADTQAMLDAYQCLNCGALTSFETGEAAPHVEFASNPQPILVTIPPDTARAGAVESTEGYVEGAAVEIPSASAETTDEPEPVAAPGPPAGEVTGGSLDAMTKAELADYAVAQGVEGADPATMTKQEMIDHIQGGG